MNTTNDNQQENKLRTNKATEQENANAKSAKVVFTKRQIAELVILLLVLVGVIIIAKQCNTSPFAESQSEQTPIEQQEVPEESATTDDICVVAEQMPEFPGGQAALIEYLSHQVTYPEEAQANGIEGRVVCSFVVDTDGSITDVEVTRSSGDASLDQEAVRAVQSMPQWQPAQMDGAPVRVRFSLPINFTIQ